MGGGGLSVNMHVSVCVWVCVYLCVSFFVYVNIQNE